MSFRNKVKWSKNKKTSLKEVNAITKTGSWDTSGIGRNVGINVVITDGGKFEELKLMQTNE